MNLHKILANAVVLTGFILVPFVPFVVLSQTTFFPFITGKNFAFRIVVEIMFSAWIVLAFIDPAYRLKKSWLLGAFVAFLAIITLAGIFGENPTKSFWSNFERMEGVVTYFHLFAYFVVASTVLKVRDLWRPYLQFHLAVGVIMAFYTLATLSGEPSGFRISGPLGNSSYLGIYAFFNIFIAIFLSARNGFAESWQKILGVTYVAVAVLQIVVLYHTGTRGAILGLIVGVGIITILIAIFERNRKSLRVTAIGILFAIALMVGTFIAMRDSSIVKETPLLARFSEISISNVSQNARLMVWGMAYEGFKERPILGWGMENFNFVFNKYYDPNMWGQEQWFDRAHNVFFDWLVAGGILGLLGYLSLFGCAVYCIWRRAHELSFLEKSVLTGLLGGYFFQNLFVFDNLASLIYFGTILAYVESMSHAPNVPVKDSKAPKKAEGEDLTIFVSGGAFILALVLIYTVNYDGYMQNTTLIRALSERAPEGASHNLGLMKKTIAYNSYGTSEAREQLASFSTSAFDSSKGVSEAQKQFIDLTKVELIKQVEKFPSDARYQLFAGSYLAKIGDPEKALPYLEKALELSSTKQSMFFELASLYYNGFKNTKKTEELFKKAFELAPEYAEAEKYYIKILVVNGKNDEAAKIFTDRPIPGVSL